MTAEGHRAVARIPSWTAPSSGDWDDDSSASSSSEILLTRSGSDTALIPRTGSGEEVVVNLKNLSHADPRRKEILAFGSEYKKAQRAYKDLKKKEADQVKVVDRVRAELRERTYKVETKEEKERKSGKEWKGRKKKSLDKTRQKARDLQREYEESSLHLRKVQAEVKDSAVRLNEKGNQLKEAWQNRGRPKEQADNNPNAQTGLAAQPTPSPVSSFESDPEVEKLSREHDEAWERAREEARLNRIEKARARFRSAVTKEDDANVESLRRDPAFLSSPELSIPAHTPRPVPGSEDVRGRSRSILDMQKRLGLVPAPAAEASGANRVASSSGPAGGAPADGDDEERRRKEEILARLQKGRGVTFIPFNLQRELEEREVREKRETAVVAHPSRLSVPSTRAAQAPSSMQMANGRLTYHQRPMQSGKRRPSVQSRRGRSGHHNHESPEPLAEQAGTRKRTERQPLEDESEAVEVMNDEQVERETDKMRAELQEEMRMKRESRERIRERDTAIASRQSYEEEGEGVEEEREPEEEAKPKRPARGGEREKRKARAKNVREDDLREEKDMALRELQTLIEENDKLLREMEHKERERDRERRAEKEVETFLARKMDTMRKEALQQRETIESLQAELTDMRARLASEGEQNRGVDEERLRELIALQKDKADLQKELADVRQTLDATRTELDAIKQRMEAREREWEEMTSKSEREKEAGEHEREERSRELIGQLQAQIEGLTAQRDDHLKALNEEREAKGKVERQLEGARMESEERKRMGEQEVREREERLAAKEREFDEVKNRLKGKIREMKAVRQGYIEEKQQFEQERSRALDAVREEEEELQAKDREIEELREQMRKEREGTERLHDELNAIGRDREEKDHQLSLIGLKLQKVRKSKQSAKQKLAQEAEVAEKTRQQLDAVVRERDESKAGLVGVSAERGQWTEAKARLEDELDQERKMRTALEERLRRLEEERMVNDEVVKRIGQRMEKQKKEAEDVLEREREEKRKLNEMLEFERKRAAQLGREREERDQLEAQRQRERIEGGERQSQEEARLRDALEMERKGRDALLVERERELGEMTGLAQDLERERAEKEAVQIDLEREREARERLQQEKESLVALIDIERRRGAERKEAEDREAEVRAASVAKLTRDVEAVQRERDRELKEKQELVERAKREREALQRELQSREEEITLKKEKTKLLRQKILVLMEENQRIKDGSRRDKERDMAERERKRDEEAKRAREEKDRQRLEKEREREERERIKKEKEKEVQEKERIRKEKEREVEEKEKLRREMEREREEKERLQRTKEQELDELRRDLQEKEVTEKTIYWADVNAYCAGDVPRGALDLYTYLSQYKGTAAQKAKFVRKVINAISTSIQREAEDAEMQSFWLSYVSTLSHMVFGQGEVETRPGVHGRDLIKDLRNLVVTRSVKERGIVSRFWLEQEKRNMTSDEVKRALAEAIEKEKIGAAANDAALVLLHLEAVMLDALTNLLNVMMRNLAPLLVPAILEYRPFLSRRKSMVRREREKDKRTRPSEAGVVAQPEEGPKVSPEEVTHMLKAFLQTTQKKKLYPSVVQVIFEDAAYMIDAHLFNTLIQRGELCTSAIGFQIKFGLSPIREWLFAANFANPARIRDCLGHIEEAANVLVVDKKLFTNGKDVKDIFHLLNPVQILHFLSAFRTDEASEAVPQESLQAVRHTITRTNEQRGVLRLKLDPHANPLPPSPDQ